jgi:hypothetical protein
VLRPLDTVLVVAEGFPCGFPVELPADFGGGLVDVDDFISFRVGEAIMDLEAAPYGGARFPVESRMDGRTFARFHVDVGIGDVILEPVETMFTRDWLDFAEIASPSVQMISREQQLAEKIHAYTIPRNNPNSRVRDLVDLYLLVTKGCLESSKSNESLRRTFTRRGTHEIPQDLAPPPPDWARPFQILVQECQLEIGYQPRKSS